MRRKRLFVALAAIGVVCSLAVIFAWFSGCRRPSDQRIREQFSKHAAEFSELKEMILCDKGVPWVSPHRVGNYWLESGKWTLENVSSHERQMLGNATLDERQMLEHVGLTAERYHRYLDLLKKAGAQEVCLWDSDSGEVRFMVYAGGLAVAGTMKSIVYCEKPPTPLVEDTDEAMKTNFSLGHVYAHIYGNWYISTDWE